MSYFESIILGLVQGLGEFLPISSSAHLVIVPWLGQFRDPGLAFDVALHFGTLFAIIIYFWKDWYQLTRGFFRHYFFSSSKISAEVKVQDQKMKNLMWLLVLATIPGALVGLMLEGVAEEVLRQPLVVAANMTLMGTILLWADWKAKEKKTIEDISWKEALAVGLSQSIALIPGVSRSGITMTTGLLVGLHRASSARFSFLMAAPITLGACLLKFPDLYRQGINGPIVIGVLVSALFGFLSIKYLLEFLQKYSFRVFVYYRYVFTLLVLVIYYLRMS